MAFEIELFFLVIDRVNFMGESSPRAGLLAVPIGESLFIPDIPSGFKPYAAPRMGLLPIVGELAEL